VNDKFIDGNAQKEFWKNCTSLIQIEDWMVILFDLGSHWTEGEKSNNVCIFFPIHYLYAKHSKLTAELLTASLLEPQINK
jgi:hypothetical protein